MVDVLCKNIKQIKNNVTVSSIVVPNVFPVVSSVNLPSNEIDNKTIDIINLNANTILLKINIGEILSEISISHSVLNLVGYSVMGLSSLKDVYINKDIYKNVFSNKTSVFSKLIPSFTESDINSIAVPSSQQNKTQPNTSTTQNKNNTKIDWATTSLLRQKVFNKYITFPKDYPFDNIPDIVQILITFIYNEIEKDAVEHYTIDVPLKGLYLRGLTLLGKHQ